MYKYTIGIVSAFAILMFSGCAKQLVKVDDLSIPVVVSSNTVNITPTFNASSNTINVASNNEVNVSSHAVNVCSGNSVNVSSGAFSNNNFDVHIPSQAITGAIDKFIKGGKWWQWLLLIVGLVFVLATEIIVKGKKDKNG
jgi:hypothetical protein